MPTGAQIAELNREVSSAAMLSFVVIEHPQLPGGVLRYVTDVLPYVWGGEEFSPIGGIELPLADDMSDPARLSVTIPNIDRRNGQVLRSAPRPLVVQQYLLSSADFDLTVTPRTEVGTAVPFYEMQAFETVDANFDAVAAEVSLMQKEYSQAQWGLYAIQSLLPGVRR